MMPRDIVLLSTADWDNPFWTNKQHVAVQLAERGCRVLYIDSLGLRRPSGRAQDLRRVLRRVRRGLQGVRRARPNLRVLSPIVLPWQGNAGVRAANRRLLSAALGARMRRLGFVRPLLWTYNPMTTWLLDTRAFEGIVYHCVDDIATQPGMPGDILARAEEELVRRADILFASSPRLAETRRPWNSHTHFLPNVADYDHFSRALAADVEVPADLARIPGPRLGFIGAVSGYKLDLPLLRAMAERRPDWSIVLIGREGEGDPSTDISQLDGLPNLHRLGPRPYTQLPAYLKGFDVALLPSARNAYTDSMFPMKFFEYLAAGRPVVSTDLPALADFAHAITLARTHDAFITGVDAVLSGPDSSREARLALARRHTYAARMDRMLALLEERRGSTDVYAERVA